MDNLPFVSVILTSYNHEKYIEEALNSVLKQTFTNLEVIIWDDASSDSSWEIISRYSDHRIRKYRNNSNKWAVEGINSAILTKAKGEFIAIHHSDDIWELDKVEKQVQYLTENPSIGAVFTKAKIINEEGEPLIDKDHFYSNIFQQPNKNRYKWLNRFFYEGNALCHPSIMIRKECYEQCGVYRYGLAQMPDFDMWVRLCLQYNIYILDEELVKFRVRDDDLNTSADKLHNRSRNFFEFYIVLKNYLTIYNSKEFLKIFPFADKYLREGEIDTEFALAMILLEEGPTLSHKFLGMEILFFLFQDDDRAEYLKSEFGIDHVKLIEFSAKYGMPYLTVEQLEEEILSRDIMISRLEEVVERENLLQTQQNELTSSFSWKVTKPIRIIGRVIAKISRPG